jgi:hypothetical protein
MTGTPVSQRGGRRGHDVAVARVSGDHMVHLVASGDAESLCGHPTRGRPPRTSFREAGCDRCLRAALAAGHLAALEGDRSWINLRRLVPATA